MENDQILKIPFLGGQHVEIGMLYDRRNDAIVPKYKLWKDEDISKHITEEEYKDESSFIVCDADLQARGDVLDLDQGLRASFLCGLKQPEGVAKYLFDAKQSSQDARVTLRYRHAVSNKTLNIAEVNRDNIKCSVNFKQNMATHVIVGLTYGVHEIFVFDYKVSEAEPKAGEELEAVVKMITGTIASTSGVQINTNDIRCKHFGKYKFKREPTTYQGMTQAYKSISCLTNDDCKSLGPIVVWLLPLSAFEKVPTEGMQVIGENSINRINKYISELESIEGEIHHLIIGEIYRVFPSFSSSVDKFNGCVAVYNENIKRKLAELAREIRLSNMKGGEMKLLSLIEGEENNPFTKACLDEWIKDKYEEVSLVEKYFKRLEKAKVVSNNELHQLLRKGKDMVCFEFNIHEEDDCQLSKMKTYVTNGSENNKEGLLDDFDDDLLGVKDNNQAFQPWFKTKAVLQDMRKSALDFVSFMETNSHISFYVTAKSLNKQKNGASILLYKGGKIVHKEFHTPSKPGKPFVKRTKHDKATISWKKPDTGVEFIRHYLIQIKKVDESQWQTVEAHTRDEMWTIGDLKPETQYSFKVQGICEVGGTAVSEESESVITDKKQQTLAEIMAALSGKSVETRGSLNVYRLPLKETMKDKIKKVRRFNLGVTNTGKSEKVIMVVGATGAGKSTLLNGIVNYVMGVQWRDPFRFKVVTPKDEESEHDDNQAFSQTEYITAYTFYHENGMPFNYNLTIIDTPGYGDCRGIERDQQITEQIREFFKHNNGVDHLDAVCFVASAPGRLTPTQKYIIESILAVFAQDVKDNILLLVTFADGQKPPVLDSVEEANIPFRNYFKFNNSALFAENDTDASVDEIFWKMGNFSLGKFFEELNEVQPRSLRLTQEVLQERQQLETTIQGLQPQINSAIQQMQNLETEQEVLAKYQRQINDNQNFTYVVPEEKTVKRDIKPNNYVTNCQYCNMSCHYPCRIPKDDDKNHCWAMTGENCRICPNKCHWTAHHNMTFWWETVSENVTKVYEERKKEFEVAQQSKSGQEQLVSKFKARCQTIQKTVFSFVSTVKTCLNRLSEIALRPNPLTAVDYVDVLIQTEKHEAKMGWEKRVDRLREVRKKAELIQNIDEGKDLLSNK